MQKKAIIASATESEVDSIMIDLPLSQNLPQRRKKGSLDLYSDDKVSQDKAKEASEADEDNRSLEEWLRKRNGKAKPSDVPQQ